MCVEDSSRSGRPAEIDTDKVKVLVDENPYSTTRDIAGELQISHPSVLKHISKICYVSILDAWVPHTLAEAQIACRIEICDLLIRRERHRPFFKSLVTGDERWTVHNNIKRKRS